MRRMRISIRTSYADGTKKRPPLREAVSWEMNGDKSVLGLAHLGLADATNCAEPFLEFVDTSLGIDELGEPGKEWVRIRGDTCGNYGVHDTVDGFLFVGRLSGFCDETRARSHVNEDDGIVLWMEILFHLFR